MIIFDWNKIETNKTSGITKVKCPECTPTRKNKTDRSLYVNFNSGVAKCFNCEALSFRDSVKQETEKKYTIPVQTWKNYTTLSDEVVKYFEKRKIHQYTLTALNVTEEMYYQPLLKKEVKNIVFNYFEGDVVVNKKYRSGGKKFTQSTGGKPIFYNINSAIGQKEVYLVEGEIDVLSFYEIDIKNVISVPNGANDNDAYWLNSEPYLKEVERFYIAVDDDEKGNELAEKIAQRLGRYRCERVLFTGKDANEDLVSGELVKGGVIKTKKYPTSGTFTVEDLYDGMIELYENGLPSTIFPKHHCFGDLKKIFSVMRGHLVVPTGIPSHGKSNFTEWYVMNIVRDYNMKASFFSPEHSPMELHQTTFVQKTFGKNYFKAFDSTPRVTIEEIEAYKNWANEKIYLTSPENGKFATWDWLFEKFREQLFNYGIDVFVIDAFNKVEFADTKGNRLDQISSVLAKLTSFAQINNVIIFLIAHPTKMKKDVNGVFDIPTLYDVSGSADFRNQTHDGFCIYRYFGDAPGQNKTIFVNLKTKFSFQGEIGKSVEFDYHIPSGRYYEKGTQVPTFSLLEEYNEEEKPIYQHAPTLDIAFPDNNDDDDPDIPF